MSQPQDEISQRIEDGTYFAEGREWYNRMYIAPISQRILFIIITCIAVSVYLMTTMSVINLLPLSPRVPFVYRNPRMVTETPRIERFKAAGEIADPALIRFYLSEYVTRREAYNSRQYQINNRFIKHYSMPEEYKEYYGEVTHTNPQSPIRRFGQFKEIFVEVNNVQFQREMIPYSAQIDFSTIIADKQTEQKSNWTATITFEYTDLIVRDNYNEELGDYILDFDEPTFKILSYEKRERLQVAQ